MGYGELKARPRDMGYGIWLGFEPGTCGFEVGRLYHCATRAAALLLLRYLRFWSDNAKVCAGFGLVQGSGCWCGGRAACAESGRSVRVGFARPPDPPEERSRGPLHGRFVCLAVVLSVGS